MQTAYNNKLRQNFLRRRRSAYHSRYLPVKETTMNYRLIFILISILPISQLASQNQSIDKIVGTYSDELGGVATTSLVLKSDSTFELTTVDPIFSYTFQNFANNGKFTFNKNEVTLNPELAKRSPSVEFNTSRTEDQNDSLFLTFRYVLHEFQNDELVNKREIQPEILTIFINDNKKEYHLVQNRIDRNCVFSRKVKNQIEVDSTNKVILPKSIISKIGVYTYGFDEIIWTDIILENPNEIEMNIIQPIDIERKPRSKKVIIKRNKAYFYERDGKIDKSLIPLVKQKTGR